MGYDDHHPPSAELLADCVHCGFCLSACPTYVLWGEEMDSPRGRIHLLSQVANGAELNGAVATHLDRCLSCMGCVTACPSGVAYDELIEAARPQLERAVTRGLAQRLQRSLVFSLFPYPRRLRIARGLLRLAERSGIRRLLQAEALQKHVPPFVRATESLAPKLAPIEQLPSRLPTNGERRGTVAMLAGCIQSVFFSEVNAATARVLQAEGFDVVLPRAQACCGALSGHAGREPEAIRFAKATIAAFENVHVDVVVVNAAGCGSAMKEYGRLLRDEPGWSGRAAVFSSRTRDLSEFLVEKGARARRHPIEARVAYHDACHLAHAQHIRLEPRLLLSGIPGIEIVEIGEGELCCGSAGVYNLLNPGPARELGRRKAEHALATGADVLVTTNPGCLMQIRSATEAAGEKLPGLHLAQVLDASLRGTALPL